MGRDTGQLPTFPSAVSCGLQGQAGTQTSILTVPGYGELPASPELLQASAELAHAQSAAEALTEDASLLLASASASSLSVGESIMEGAINDLLQAAAPDLQLTPSRQQSQAQAAIQTGSPEVPTQLVRHRSQAVMTSKERAERPHRRPQALTEAAVQATLASQAGHPAMQPGSHQVTVQAALQRQTSIPVPSALQDALAHDCPSSCGIAEHCCTTICCTLLKAG